MKKLNMMVILLLVPISVGAEPGWRFVTPMPHGRYGHAATLGPDGRIYVMGGMACRIKQDGSMGVKEDSGALSNLVYDPWKATWEYRAPVPGWESGGTFHLYDPDRNRWRALRYVRHKGDLYVLKRVNPLGGEGEYLEMSPDKLRNTDFDRQGNGVAIVSAKDGRIWWIGGMGKPIGNGKGENTVFQYDPATDQWPKVTAYEVKSQTGGGFYRMTTYHTDIPPMHERRIDHQAVVTADGKIYVMGGYRPESREDPDPVLGMRAVSNTMECYDPRTSIWEYKKPLSSVRMRFAAVVGPDDKIYVFGGAEGMANKDATPVLNTTEVYDPKTDSWTLRKPMPEPRQAHAAVLGPDGKIYVMGGTSSVPTPPLNDVFIYDPLQDSWTRGPKMKVPRAVLAAVATPNGEIYAIGGTDIGAYSGRKKLNFFLPKVHEFYTGKVQDTVEVLDISPLEGANR